MTALFSSLVKASSSVYPGIVDIVLVPGAAEGCFGIQFLITRQHVRQNAGIANTMGVVLFSNGIESAARIAGLADEEEEIGNGYGIFFALGLRQEVITENYGRGLSIELKALAASRISPTSTPVVSLTSFKGEFFQIFFEFIKAFSLQIGRMIRFFF